MSDWPVFIPGEIYAWEEMEGYTYPDRGSTRPIPPGTLFRYSKEPGAYYGHFDEVQPENPNGLVSDDEVHDAIEQLRRRGLDARDIARASGVSLDSANRPLRGTDRFAATRENAIRAAANGCQNGLANELASTTNGKNGR